MSSIGSPTRQSRAQEILDTLISHSAEAVVVADLDGQIAGMSGPAVEFLRDGDGGIESGKKSLSAALCGTDEIWHGELDLGTRTSNSITINKVHVPIEGGMNAILAWLTNPAPASGASGTDTLTGLPNRTIFFDRLQQAMLLADRASRQVAVLLIGVDHMALVNDALGVRAGDELLVEFAKRLGSCSRSTDTISRIEGDYFGMVMSIAATNDSVLVAEKVFAALKKPFTLAGREHTVTVSIGIGLYPVDGREHEELIKRTESALRYAKTQGRSQYQFISGEMTQRARHRLELEGRLRQAIANQEFVVYYQPKVSVENHTIKGMEALVRWQSPERGLVPPGEFIGIAEETGLIENIGAFVMVESCRQNAEWLAEGLPPLKLSVNVAARQFRSPRLIDDVAAVLAKTGLPAKLLELEITESMLMDGLDQTVKKMTDLRALGIGLSIDDFGTGYSSLSYLSQFPINTLKIDRAFVHDVETNAKTAEIARAIIGLCKSLDLEIVAEGAELFEHVEFLRLNGCGLIQGFFYSRPLTAPDFAALVRKGPLRPQREIVPR